MRSVEAKTLERKWARISLLLSRSGWWLFLGAGIFFREWLEGDFGLPAFEIGMLGLGIELLGIVLWCGMSRCPHCGKRGEGRSWVYRKLYCSCCGHVLPFDDGPLSESETPLDRRQRFRVKRSRARLILVLSLAGMVFVVGTALAFNLMMPSFQTEDELWAVIKTIWSIRDICVYVGLAGIVLWGIAGVLTSRWLRCPGCAQGLAAPWQGRGQIRWCQSCGAALAFEDELEYEKT